MILALVGVVGLILAGVNFINGGADARNIKQIITLRRIGRHLFLCRCWTYSQYPRQGNLAECGILYSVTPFMKQLPLPSCVPRKNAVTNNRSSLCPKAQVLLF